MSFWTYIGIEESENAAYRWLGPCDSKIQKNPPSTSCFPFPPCSLLCPPFQNLIKWFITVSESYHVRRQSLPESAKSRIHLELKSPPPELISWAVACETGGSMWQRLGMRWY